MHLGASYNFQVVTMHTDFEELVRTGLPYAEAYDDATEIFVVQMNLGDELLYGNARDDAIVYCRNGEGEHFHRV